MPMKFILKFFDKLEDKIRHLLSKIPGVYALIGGVGIVLFWRGVWHLADDYGMSSWEALIISIIIMLATGTFVSFFIGEQILISGLKEEKRIDQRTEAELKEEEKYLNHIVAEISEIRKDVKILKEQLVKQPRKSKKTSA